MQNKYCSGKNKIHFCQCAKCVGTAKADTWIASKAENVKPSLIKSHATSSVQGELICGFSGVVKEHTGSCSEMMYSSLSALYILCR